MEDQRHEIYLTEASPKDILSEGDAAEEDYDENVANDLEGSISVVHRKLKRSGSWDGSHMCES